MSDPKDEKASKVKLKKAATFNTTPKEKALLERQRAIKDNKKKCNKGILEVLSKYGFELRVEVSPYIILSPTQKRRSR